MGQKTILDTIANYETTNSVRFTEAQKATLLSVVTNSETINNQGTQVLSGNNLVAQSLSNLTTETERVNAAVVALRAGKLTPIVTNARNEGLTPTQVDTVNAARTTSENLSIGTNGFSTNSRITANNIPALNQGSINTPSYVILHRTVSSNITSPLNSARNTGVGTHFYVGTDGAIVQASSMNNRTSHLRSTGRGGVFDRAASAPHNNNSIGIEVVGNYNATTRTWDPLTARQIESVAFLVNSLKTTYNISQTNVRNHEDVQPKTAGEGATVSQAIAPYMQNRLIKGSLNEVINNALGNTNTPPPTSPQQRVGIR
jgi:N-acetylmuramoyl-L-alanine amidase